MQQWRGLVWGPQRPIVLEEISLQSPADTWPPVIRLDYSIDGIAGRWEAPWDDQVMRESSIEAAAPHGPDDPAVRARHRRCLTIATLDAPMPSYGVSALACHDQSMMLTACTLPPATRPSTPS
jgi:hypothetical protein